jgi:GxxExxY protein
MNENELSNLIIGCAINVHHRIGAGLLESAYVACLHHDLLKAGLKVEREKAVPLIYEGVTLDCGYRLDLLVNDKVIIEVKSVEKLDNVHLAQILTYLKLADKKLGLLMNFNVIRLKDGIRRVVNGL